MVYLRRFFKGVLWTILSILFLAFIFTIFNYFNIIDGKIFTIIKTIIPLLSLALGGFVLGKFADKNGWFEGIKLGLFMCFFMFLSSIFLKMNINIKDWIFYLLLIICSIFGSMIGINTKKTN